MQNSPYLDRRPRSVAEVFAARKSTSYDFDTLAERGIPFARIAGLTDEDRKILMRLAGKDPWEIGIAYLATTNI